MKRKDENGHAGKQNGGPPAPEKETANGAEAGLTPESLVDIGPEADAATLEPEVQVPPAAETAPSPEQLEVARLTDRLLRLQADFDNFRKRTNRERDELQKRAGEAILADLVPILDNLEFGLQQAMKKPGGESFVEGLKLIQLQMMETTRRHGLEPIDALGKEFDPRLHEAIGFSPSPDIPEGKIMAQTRRGYKLGDKLLRAAMVMVSGGSGDSKKGGEG
jgi:molecular chaperone GrpE